MRLRLPRIRTRMLLALVPLFAPWLPTYALSPITPAASPWIYSGDTVCLDSNDFNSEADVLAANTHLACLVCPPRELTPMEGWRMDIRLGIATQGCTANCTIPEFYELNAAENGGYERENQRRYSMLTRHNAQGVCDGVSVQEPGFWVKRRRTVGCPFAYAYSESFEACVFGSIPIDPNKNGGSCAGGGAGSSGAGTSLANPINAAIGYKLQTETDFVGSGAHPLRFQRYYQSGHPQLDPNYNYFPGLTLEPSRMGRHWRHNYERRISFVEGTNLTSYRATATAQRENGNQYRFNINSTGTITQDPDVQLRLAKQVDGTGQLIGWTLTDESDTVEQYDAAGLLVAMTFRDGQSHTLSYVQGRLDRVTDAYGRYLEFDYAPAVGSAAPSLYRLSTVTAPDGTRIRFEYNPDFNAGISTIKKAIYEWDSDGGGSSVREYIYTTFDELNPEPAIQLLGIIDENLSRFATWEYDSLGRATLSYHGPVNDKIDRVELTYNNTQATSTTAEQWLDTGTSKIRNYAYSVHHGVAKLASVDAPCPSCGGANVNSRTYDANGNVNLVTDFAGTVTDYNHDARGLETQRIEAKSTPTDSAPDEKRTIQTDWHANFRVPTERRVYGVVNDLDVLETKSTFTYNTRGQVLTSTQINPQNGATRTTAYTYCDTIDSTCPLLGLTKTINGPRTDVTDVSTFTYYTDNAGDGSHRIGDLWKVTNASGHVSEFLKYDAAGRVLSQKDINGVVTELEYHARGWLTARKVRGANNAVETDDAITRIAHDAVGQITRTTQPDGSYLEYGYDAAHRLVTVNDSLGNRIDYTLDSVGNRKQERTYDPGNALKRRLAREYDLLSRLDKERDAIMDANNPNGRLLADHGYDANGNRIETLDGLNHSSTSIFDPLNRLKVRIQDDAIGGIEASAQYKFDARDNLRKVIDPKNLTTEFVFDGLNDLTSLISPDTGTATYTYDGAGNRMTRTDARGITTTYAYDHLNRLSAIDYPDSSLSWIFGYDDLYCLDTGGDFSKGRLTAIVGPTSETYLCYDRRGNLVGKEQIINGATFTTRYTYSLADRLTGITYPSGAEVAFARDTLGRIGAITATLPGQSPTTIVSAVNYLPFGPLTQLTFGNGRTLNKAYDANYAIDQVSSSAAGGLTLDFTVDVLGNIVGAGATVGANPPTRSYTYDALYRLDEVRDQNSVLKEDFSYDDTGNRLTKKLKLSTQTYAYATNSHRLQSIDSVTRSYDANGNLVANPVSIGPQTFVYDQRNRLVEYQQSGHAEFAYDYNGRGERVAKRDLDAPSADRFFVYDESGQLLGEYDVSGNVIQEYVYLDNTPIAVLKNNLVYYVEADHLGTPRAVVEIARNVAVWKWDFMINAFGENLPTENPDGDGTTFALNLRFPGQYFDSESALHYNYFRDYEAGTGRYAESDPIGLRGGISTYGYVRQNPGRFVDPRGLKVYKCGGTINSYYHEWVCVDTNCAGKYPDPASNGWDMISGNEGQILPDPLIPEMCREVGVPGCCSQAVFESCVSRFIATVGARETYSIFWNNCIAWVNHVLASCTREACSK